MRPATFLLALSGALLFITSCGAPGIQDDEGRIALPDEWSSPIVGGTTTSSWDSVVLLYAGGGICTGTLISPDVVLTASHCLEGVYGSLDVYWCDQCIQGGYLYYEHSRTSNDYHMHPWYNPSNMIADIAVVVLNNNGPTTPIHINKDAASNSWLGAGNELKFVGFGVTQYYLEDSGINRVVDIAIDEWDGTFLYYYDSQHQTCFGDSGGPAFTDHSGEWRVAGVTSYGDEHCDTYGGDIRVDTYASWIDGYTGGWTPDDDDDDDSQGDDDDSQGDDDDYTDDDDDYTDDDDDFVDDDDSIPPVEDLPNPKTNAGYGAAQGLTCVGDHVPGRVAGSWVALLAVIGLAGWLRRR